MKKKLPEKFVTQYLDQKKMHLLDLPMEILQMMVDNLDLAHQLMFRRLCRKTYQLDITNFWDIKRVIKSVAITEKILQLYPRIKWLNLKNNGNVKKINLVNLEKIYVGGFSHVPSTVKKIYVSDSQYGNIYPLNNDAEIIKASRFKLRIGENSVKNLWKNFEKSERLQVLSNQLRFSSSSMHPILLLCAIKYCCIDSVKIILTNFPALIHKPIKLPYLTVLNYACLSSTRTIRMMKHLLTQNIDKRVCYNAHINMCWRFESKQDIVYIKLLVEYCDGKKISICFN